MFKQGLNTIRIGALHRLAVDRAHRSLANAVDRKNCRLDGLVAVTELEAGVHLDLSPATLQSSLVRSKLNAHLTNFHRDHFRAVCEQMQVDGRIVVCRAKQHRTNQSW